jgi:hypothetical protein
MSTYAQRQISRGAYFAHTKWLDSNNQSLRCKVTRIARGMVYYRPHYGWLQNGTEWLGTPWKFAMEDADKYVAGPTSPYPGNWLKGAKP